MRGGKRGEEGSGKGEGRRDSFKIYQKDEVRDHHKLSKRDKSCKCVARFHMGALQGTKTRAARMHCEELT